MPTRPEDTLLLLVGPDTSQGFNTGELMVAAQQLRALGYRVAEAQVGGYAMLPLSDGIARTERWYENQVSRNIVDAAEALNKPVLGIDAWARAIAPGARGWYEELFAA